MLSFNGTTVKTVKYTGKDINGKVVTGKNLTDIVYNGTHVWCTPPSIGTTYTITRYIISSSSYTYKLHFKIVNNSTKRVTYTCRIGPKTVTVTIDAGDYENATIDYGRKDPGTSAIVATINYLGDSVRATVAYGRTDTLM